MKRSTLLVTFAVVSVALGCGKNEPLATAPVQPNQPSTKPTLKARSAEERDPALANIRFFNFFPLEIGTKWVYSVEIGDIHPLVYRETSWPTSKLGYVERRHPLAFFTDGEKKKTFAVGLTITKEAATQGQLKYPIGREVAIDVDDLGFYGGAKQLFWALTTQERFTVFEVRVYSDEKGPVGVPVEGDGFEQRLLFFGDKQKMSIGLNQEFVEHLIYHGVVDDVPGYQGTPCVHLQRTLKAGEGEDALSKGWTEDSWYAKKKGLVRLVQRIDGMPSMTWTLQQLSYRSVADSEK